eukprot:1157815-Pelagomonas_calceolata.AAC.1
MKSRVHTYVVAKLRDLPTPASAMNGKGPIQATIVSHGRLNLTRGSQPKLKSLPRDANISTGKAYRKDVSCYNWP